MEELKDNKELFLKYYENKNDENFNNLFLNNTNLVEYTILKTVNLPLRTKKQILDEFLDIGYIGLMNAITSYDIQKIDEINFSTYAYTCIRNEVIKNLVVRPSQLDTNISIDKTVYDDSETTIGDFLGKEDDNYEKVFNEDNNEYYKKVTELLLDKISDPYHKKIIEMYFGLNDEEKHRFVEIGNEFGQSKQNIETIYKKELFRLKNILDRNGFDSIEELNLSINEMSRVISNSLIEDNLYIRRLLKKYSEEEILQQINNLSDRRKIAVKCYLGIDGYSKMTNDEISNFFNMSSRHVGYISLLFKDLENELKRKKPSKIKKYLDIKKETLNNKIKNERLNKLKNVLKADNITILKLYNELNKNDKLLIDLYYGFNDKIYSISEIAKLTSTSEEEIKDKIINVVKNMRLSAKKSR